MKKLLLLFILFAFGCDQKPETIFEIQPEPVSKGPIRVKVAMAHKEISILDTQKLKIEIEAPVEYSLTTPSLAERLEDFRQVPWRFDEEEIIDGKLKIKKYFAFELYESGKQVLPPFVIKYSSGAGEQRLSGSLKTPKLEFNIIPVESTGVFDTPLHAEAGLERQEPFPWLKWTIIITGVLGLIIGGILAFDRFFSKKKEAPVVITPAHLLAYNELQALIERKKEEEIPGEQFVTELSEILRRYIERRFHIRAPEQTTEEFLEILTHQRTDINDKTEVLQRFLEFCDLVKFATLKVSDEDMQKGFDFLKDFIENTKQEGDLAA